MEIEHKNDLLSQELDKLMAREKQARQNSDLNESIKVVMQIITLIWEQRDLVRLQEYLIGLAKKRGQPKKTIIEMVNFVMKNLDNIPNLDDRLKIVEALKQVTDKKIYLEVEFARCAMILVKHKDTENEKREASKILEDVQVETYASMEPREKLEFILYLMKILLELKDYVKFTISSRKVSKKALNDNDLADLRIAYYSYMLKYYVHESMYSEAADAYKIIFETLHKATDLSKLEKTIDFGFRVSLTNMLENYVLYLVSNPFSSEQQSQLHALQTNYFLLLEKHPHLNKVIKSFVSKELISTNFSDYNLANMEIFDGLKTEHAEEHQAAFIKQLIQHNIHTIEQYYSRITLAKLTKLLAVQKDTAETELCEMINKKLVYAKIDRMNEIVDFRKKKGENEILNEWNADISKALDLIDQSFNLLKRDYEVLS